MASSLFHGILKTGLSALLVVKWTFKYLKQDVGMHSTFLRHITSCRLPLPVVLPMSGFGGRTSECCELLALREIFCKNVDCQRLSSHSRNPAFLLTCRTTLFLIR
jgi:hypothetical protein